MFDGVLSDYKLTPILFSRHFKKRTSMTWNWSLVSESDVRYFPSKSGFRYIYRRGFYHKTNTTSLFLQSSSPVAMVWKLTCQICFLTTTLARLAWAKCILTKIKTIFPKSAFVAQWLEHWSCKPGVKSSNLFEGWRLRNVLFFSFYRVLLYSITVAWTTQKWNLYKKIHLPVILVLTVLENHFYLNTTRFWLRKWRTTRLCLIQWIFADRKTRITSVINY